MKMLNKITQIILPAEKTKTALLFLVAILVTACVAPTYVTPEISNSEIHRASNEISRSEQRTVRNITLANATSKARQIYRTVEGGGKSYCVAEGDKSINECSTGWSLSLADDEDFNAFAHGRNSITLNKGVLQVANDTELAFTIAHEIGHHALNHLNENRTNTVTGAIVGGIIGVAIVEALGGCQYNCDPAADLIISSAEAGSEVGTALYSREQESEADLFALKVIAESGYQPSEARSIITHIGKIGSGGARSNFGDSHPSGPERLANLDKMLDDWRRPLERLSTADLESIAEIENYPSAQEQARALRGRLNEIVPDYDSDLGAYIPELEIWVDPKAVWFPTDFDMDRKGIRVTKVDPNGPGAINYRLRENDHILEAYADSIFKQSTKINSLWDIREHLSKYGVENTPRMQIKGPGTSIWNDWFVVGSCAFGRRCEGNSRR